MDSIIKQPTTIDEIIIICRMIFQQIFFLSVSGIEWLFFAPQNWWLKWFYDDIFFFESIKMTMFEI